MRISSVVKPLASSIGSKTISLTGSERSSITTFSPNKVFTSRSSKEWTTSEAFSVEIGLEKITSVSLLSIDEVGRLLFRMDSKYPLMLLFFFLFFLEKDPFSPLNFSMNFSGVPKASIIAFSSSTEPQKENFSWKKSRTDFFSFESKKSREDSKKPINSFFVISTPSFLICFYYYCIFLCKNQYQFYEFNRYSLNFIALSLYLW